MHLTPSLEQMVFKSLIGISMMRDRASWVEFTVIVTYQPFLKVIFGDQVQCVRCTAQVRRLNENVASICTPNMTDFCFHQHPWIIPLAPGTWTLFQAHFYKEIDLALRTYFYRHMHYTTSVKLCSMRRLQYWIRKMHFNQVYFWTFLSSSDFPSCPGCSSGFGYLVKWKLLSLWHTLTQSTRGWRLPTATLPLERRTCWCMCLKEANVRQHTRTLTEYKVIMNLSHRESHSSLLLQPSGTTSKIWTCFFREYPWK